MRGGLCSMPEVAQPDAANVSFRVHTPTHAGPHTHSHRPNPILSSTPGPTTMW